MHFLEQTDIAGGTITLLLFSEVADLDSGDFLDVTSSDVEDDINCNLQLIILEITRVEVYNIRTQLKGDGSTHNINFIPKNVSSVDDKI